MSIGQPQRAIVEAALGAPVRPEQRAGAFAAALRKWLGVEMTVLDVDAAEVVCVGAGQLPWKVELLWELCRQVAARRQPEYLADEDGMVVLAVPAADLESPLVAIGGFLTRPLANSHDANRIARALGVDGDAFLSWSSQQNPIAAATLERTAKLMLEHNASSGKIDELEWEVQKLTGQLCGIYEEISLIYRLTHNLNLLHSGEELARLALGGLLEIVPAQAVAAQLFVSSIGSEPRWFLEGDLDFTPAEFYDLIGQLQLSQRVRPVVINRPVTEQASWQSPKIRELIVVPLADGERLFGWMAAFNHTRGGEFGTVEADLLTSASAILGIHCGNTELYDTQADALASFVRAMTSAIDAKDTYTCGHSERVARVAVRLAKEMRCARRTVETLYLGGLLHDVGKIGIDDVVLRKPGKLTAEEFELIKTHTQIGFNILSDIKQLAEVLPIVLHHHESWDGNGYPMHLSGEEIPFMARITAVADAFDAMQSNRTYRRGMSDEKLDTIIADGAGRQWDANVVQAFFACREDIRAIAQSPLGEPPVNLKSCFHLRR